jgi:hypothetical protein
MERLLVALPQSHLTLQSRRIRGLQPWLICARSRTFWYYKHLLFLVSDGLLNSNVRLNLIGRSLDDRSRPISNVGQGVV